MNEDLGEKREVQEDQYSAEVTKKGLPECKKGLFGREREKPISNGQKMAKDYLKFEKAQERSRVIHQHGIQLCCEMFAISFHKDNKPSQEEKSGLNLNKFNERMLLVFNIATKERNLPLKVAVAGCAEYTGAGL